jgi:SAM-dependent methyltransferase
MALGRRSVLKQAKIREVGRAVGCVDGLVCLDLGGDNGVVSAALRTRGGRWASADLGHRNVAAIREVVGGDVRAIEGSDLPFDSASFDVVVIADLLEHLEDDRQLVRECARILRPGGRLVINVPHVKPWSIINTIRHAIGLTDAWHGHVRPGYTRKTLDAVLSPHFLIEGVRTYSRAFSETIDLLMNGVFEALKRRQGLAAHNVKGPVVSGEEIMRHAGAFRWLGIAYPFLRAFSWLDAVLPLQSGYKLIVRARHVGAGTSGAPR